MSDLPSVSQALQASQQYVARLRDTELSHVMDRLLVAEAYRSGVDVSKVFVNTEEKARDRGSDGGSPAPPALNKWLGDVETCWQFKAGDAGQPAKLAGEVTKPIPKATLEAGGRFVVVANRSTNGRAGREDRLNVLRDEAADAGIPADKIDVFTSETLTRWLNEHPVIVGELMGLPPSLTVIERWKQFPAHAVPWKPTPALRTAASTARSNLDLVSGGQRCLHVRGLPGVGKTRFALELCRDAPWEKHVLYASQASDISFGDIAGYVANNPGVQLVLVVDEVHDSDVLRGYSNYVDMANGRLRLVTIGSCRTPDSSGVPVVKVLPLPQEKIQKIVLCWYPDMPFEYQRYVARFSDGFVRLAKLAADAVARHQEIDTHKLLTSEDVGVLLRKMIGEEHDVRSLYVVAIADHIGWKGDKKGEAEAVSNALGMDFSEVKARVEQLHDTYAIAPEAGNLRYISPNPLGDYLAIAAWRTYPDELRQLQGSLSGDALDAYYKRVSSIASNPKMRVFAREELLLFSRLGDFMNRGDVRRWLTYGKAEPTLALQQVLNALTRASRDERLALDDDARRELVWALEEFSRGEEHFESALFALAELAEAETESWANNATGVFLSRFQVKLGGTASAYPERLAVLDQLIKRENPNYSRLAIVALAQAAKLHESAYAGIVGREGPQQPDWRPTRDEYLLSVETAVDRLACFAEKCSEDLVEDLVEAASKFAMHLRDRSLREPVKKLFLSLLRRFPTTREDLRKSVYYVLMTEKGVWKELDDDDVCFIDKVHTTLSDKSIEGRLRRDVGVGHWIEVEPDLSGLAQDLLAEVGEFEKAWPWLTSGDADSIWRLGEALAFQDQDLVAGTLMAEFPGRGNDLRIFGAYFSEIQKIKGVGWVEDWLSAYERENPDDDSLRVYLAWCCLPTLKGARRIVDVVERSPEPVAEALRLGFGPWAQVVPFDGYLTVVSSLVSREEYLETTTAVLAHRLKVIQGGEWDKLLSVARTVVSSLRLLVAGQMTSYYWIMIAKELEETEPLLISETLMRAQAEFKDEHWAIERGQFASIFHRCFKREPVRAWNALTKYLTNQRDGYIYAIGFPSGMVDLVPVQEVLGWIDDDTDARAMLVAKLARPDFEDEGSLACTLLEKYGSQEAVRSVFYSSLVSGVWTGSSAARWEGLAERMERLAKKSPLQRVRDFAIKMAVDFRDMAEADRTREEEEDLIRK